MKSILLMVLCTLLSHAQVNILTGNGNNDRTNANLQELQLSPATVSSPAFGKLGVFPVDGQVYAQPLYVSGLSISGAGTRNVVFVSTMHNSVYAFDADAMSPVSLLWQVNLGPSVPAPLLFGQYGDIAIEVGILSTGVIDLQRGVLYVVADTLEGGSAGLLSARARSGHWRRAAQWPGSADRIGGRNRFGSARRRNPRSRSTAAHPTARPAPGQ